MNVRATGMISVIRKHRSLRKNIEHRKNIDDVTNRIKWNIKVKLKRYLLFYLLPKMCQIFNVAIC